MQLGRIFTRRFVQNAARLPNGMRAIAIDGPGACISAGILIECSKDAKNSTKSSSASSSSSVDAACKYTLEKLAFKATQTTNEQEMHKRLDGLVGSLQAKASKESILYGGIVVPTDLPALMRLMREVSERPLVREEDLAGVKAAAEYELAELEGKPDEYMPELVHLAAFGADQIDSLLSVPGQLSKLRAVDVYKYHSQHFKAEKMCLLGAGLSQHRFYDLCTSIWKEGALGDQSQPSNTISKENCTPNADVQPGLEYRAGSKYVERADAPLTNVAIAFRGSSAKNRDSYTLAILQMLMGGGSSFSAGGPGKGMYSRLYLQVLNRHHWIESFRVFNYAYGESGIFGIQGSALPANAPALTELLLTQIQEMHKNITVSELERAKSQVKSAVLMGLESRLIELESIGDQLHYTNKILNPHEICRQIDGIGMEEVVRVAEAVFVESGPSVGAFGGLDDMPSFEAITAYHSQMKKNKLF